MSIKKKIVFLPYDMDTAIGINNEGELVFDYNLEDTDHQTGGADVFNGQQSVLWNNIRDAFPDEISAMYKDLRSSGALSYAKVEKMFEDHQDKWPEAVFNEDAMFKYIDPYLEDGTDYLGMLLGSKAEQRKWWLYNRFRYMDSKFNAGDALSDTITLRPYAVGDISITPYADIYTTVNWDGTYDSKRTARGTTATHLCPYQSMNDNVVIIHSASQLASIGDLSPLKLGLCDVSKATRIQSLKVGDADSEYSNPNMRSLTLGNNVLLKLLDVRNCVGLGDTTMQGHTQTTVDISGCSIIEEVYFDGTKIQGLTLPNGGVLKKLHLPATMTNLTILNQKGITDFVMPSYANISTLRLENVPTLDTKTILNSIPSSSRVRLIGFYWTAADAAEIEALFTKLDSMRGLDEQGGNVDKAQVSGEIHTDSLTGAQIASFNERYPYVRVTADHTSALLTYKTYDGSSVIDTETVLDGGNGTKTNSTQRTSTAQYNFTPNGWATSPNGAKDNNALVGVTADRTVYAAYTSTLRSYTITFVRASADGGGTLQSSTYQYGATPKYTGATPTTTQGSATDYPFEGWTPAITTVTGATTYTAKFGSPIEVAEITDSWDTIIANIDNGTYATKYKVGNYKPLDLGSSDYIDIGTLNMQIAGIDADVDKDGNTIPLTFVSKETTSYDTGYSTKDWSKEYCTGREVATAAYENIPNNIKSRIIPATKITNNLSGGTMTTYDKVWLPSLREVGSTSNSTWVKAETTGVMYKALFSNDNSRIKTMYNSQGAVKWFTRSPSAKNDNWMGIVSDTGKITNANTGGHFVLGFCLGLEAETITDSWSDIFTNESNGTYSTKYSVGDTKMLDLGTEGKHLMQIVAMDADDLADGSGKAKITWLSRTLLNTSNNMNPICEGSSGNYTEGTGSIGGWDKCEMKTYLNTTIANLVPTEVRNNVKTVKKYTRIYNTAGTVVNNVESSETFWLASILEVGLSKYKETAGVTYSSVFTDDASRKKKTPQGPVYAEWWLRSAYYNTSFATVDKYGDISYGGSGTVNRICLGFCT